MRSTKREFKNQLYRQFERLGKALGQARRLEVLDLLAQGERRVDDVAQHLDCSVATASHHLRILKAARLLEVRREGVTSWYRVADDGVLRLLMALRDVGQTQLLEIERLVTDFFTDRRALEPISASELLNRLQRDDVELLDVRPTEEFAAGHIQGAKSIPIDQLQQRLTEIRNDREVVAYCRGPYCVFADEAVALLGAQGMRARRLDVGYPEWRLNGGPCAQ